MGRHWITLLMDCKSPPERLKTFEKHLVTPLTDCKGSPGVLPYVGLSCTIVWLPLIWRAG
jgi:hypothetical protein